MKPIVIILLTMYALISCSTLQDRISVSELKRNPNLEIINLDKSDITEAIKFSSVLGKPKTIVLETDNNCIIKEIRQIELFQDRIYLLDDESNQLYVFDMKGHYLHSIGEPGHAQGEYLEISDFSIDRNTKKIYVWYEAKDKALKFDIKTGKYLSSISTDRNGERTFAMLHYNKRLYLNRTTSNNDTKYHIKEIDEDSGQQIASYLESDRYNNGWNCPMRLSCNFFYCKNHNEPKYVEMFSDTIIGFTHKGIMPAYAIQCKDFIKKEDVETIKGNSSLNSGYYDFSKINDSDIVYQISNVAEFKNILTFQFMRGINRKYIVYDKKNKQSIVADIFCNDYIYDKNVIPMEILFSDKKYAISAIRPAYMKYFFDNIVSKGLIKRDIDNYEALMNIHEDSNPVLFLHEYK